MELSRPISDMLRFFKIFGFLPVRTQAKKRSRISIAYGIFLLAMYVSILTIGALEKKVKTHRVNTTMNLLQLACYVASALVNIAFSWMNIPEFISMMESLNTFEMRLKKMGVILDHKTIRTFSVFTILASTLILCYVGCADFYIEVYSLHTQSVLHWLTIYISVILNVYNTSQIVIFNFLLYRCFAGLTEAVKLTSKFFVIDQHKRIVNRNNTSDIQNIESAYFLLKDSCGHFNRFFGVQNLANFATAFVTITAQLYYLISATGQHLQVFTGINWVGIYAVQVIVIVSGYNFIKEKALDIANYLFRISTDLNEIQNIKISGLAQKLTYNQIVFTACGVFRIELDLLHNFVASITTYIIILIQFRNSTPTQYGEVQNIYHSASSY